MEEKQRAQLNQRQKQNQITTTGSVESKLLLMKGYKSTQQSQTRGSIDQNKVNMNTGRTPPNVLSVIMPPTSTVMSTEFMSQRQPQPLFSNNAYKEKITQSNASNPFSFSAPGVTEENSMILTPNQQSIHHRKHIHLGNPQQEVKTNQQVIQRYNTTQKNRMDSLKRQIESNLEENNEKQTQQIWNEAKVEDGVMLLRKARQLTKQSYQNRIRTGGSLIQRFQKAQSGAASDRNPLTPLFAEEQNPFLMEYSLAENGVEEFSVAKHFKHLPKLTKRQTTVRASTKLAIENQSEYLNANLVDRPKPKKSDPFHKFEKLGKNLDELEILKIDEIKTLIMPLPIVLAERAYDQQTEDYLFFQGCNLLYEQKYQEAQVHFRDAASTSKSSKMKQLLLFNHAYSLYKLYGNHERCLEIWEKESDDPFINMLANFNLSALLCYYNICTLSKTPDNQDFEKLSDCMKYFNKALALVIQIVKCKSKPVNEKTIECPTWINIDQIVQKCDKVYQRIKTAFERLPSQNTTCDPMDFNFEVDFLQKEVLSQKRQLSRMLLQYSMFFKNYKQQKVKTSRRTYNILFAVSQQDQHQQSKLTNFRVNAILEKHHASKISDNQQQSYFSTHDEPNQIQERISQYKPVPVNKTPFLIPSKDLLSFEFVPQLKMLKNFDGQINTHDDEFDIPFVESKRPETILKNRQRTKNKPQFFYDESYQMFTTDIQPKIVLVDEEINMPQTNNSVVKESPKFIEDNSPLSQKAKGSSDFRISETPKRGDNIVSREYPIGNELPVIVEDISIPDFTDKQEVRLQLQLSEKKKKRSLHVDEPSFKLSIPDLMPSSGHNTGNVSPSKSILLNAIPLHNQLSLHFKKSTPAQQQHLKDIQNQSDQFIIRDRAPQTSDFQKMISTTLDYSLQYYQAKHRNDPPLESLLSGTTSNQRSISSNNTPINVKSAMASKNRNLSVINSRSTTPGQAKGSGALSNKNASVIPQEEEPVEIDPEFKGPLITKEGQLYDDIEHDETYKKKLRLREVHQIQKYIEQLQGLDKLNVPNPDQTIQSFTSKLKKPKHLRVKFDEIDSYLQKLKFFSKYPPHIRYQLIHKLSTPQSQAAHCINQQSSATLDPKSPKTPYESGTAFFREYKAGEIIFRQGDDSHMFYVILRGSAKAILIKKEYGYIPFVVSTFYDGREIGEVTLYKESENLTHEMVTELNKQKYTCEAMELTYVLALDKELTTSIINQGLQSEFEERIRFLSQIEIFKGIDMHVLLPLANNLEVKRFKLGEYILKEGRAPKGLMIITKGKCRVGSEQINMRSKDLFPLSRLKNKLRDFKFRGNFHDMECKINIFEDNQFRLNGINERLETKDSDPVSGEEQQQAVSLEVQRIFNETRVFNNDRIRYDEKGQKIMHHIVYKDFMTFFTLNARDFFGGKVLLLKNDQEIINKQQRKGRLQSMDKTSTDKTCNQNLGSNLAVFESENESTFYMSPTNRREALKLEDYGTLSVIADSSEVEILMMDRSQMSFFPENVQKEIYTRIEKAFQPECPYSAKVIEQVKDKFNEWERYKLETVGGILKQAYIEKKKVGGIVSLDR